MVSSEKGKLYLSERFFILEGLSLSNHILGFSLRELASVTKAAPVSLKMLTLFSFSTFSEMNLTGSESCESCE